MMGREVAVENRGGKRKGAGRPPVLERQLEQAKLLARQLHIGLQSGLNKLGEAYPELMDIAIRSAKGELSEDKKPDLRMLAMLVEFLPKVAGSGEVDETTPFARLLNDVKSRVIQFQQVNNYGSLPPSGGTSAGEFERESVTPVGIRVLEPGETEDSDGR